MNGFNKLLIFLKSFSKKRQVVEQTKTKNICSSKDFERLMNKLERHTKKSVEPPEKEGDLYESDNS